MNPGPHIGLTPDDRKLRRAARRARAMSSAADRATWSGAASVVPNRKRQAARRACRGWTYDGE